MFVQGVGGFYVSRPAFRVMKAQATDPYAMPLSIFDEVADVCARLGIT